MQDSLDDGEQSNQASFEFHNLEDFKDYNQPKTACCLVKAVCVYTKLVDLEGTDSLSGQFKKKLNGSLELRTWTGWLFLKLANLKKRLYNLDRIKIGLPQGSGLGTSSILIACVLKVVWYVYGLLRENLGF